MPAVPLVKLEILWKFYDNILMWDFRVVIYQMFGKNYEDIIEISNVQ